MAACLETIPLLEEEVTEVLEADANCKGSLDIFVVGKPGSGKSSLCKDLLGPNARDVPIVDSGLVPVTECMKVYKYPDNDCSVTITDTRGLFDGQEEGYEQATAHKLREVCQNDRKRNGVVLFCNEMFGGRLDEACLASLAMLHKICGKEIWRYVVIALTKADMYPAVKWYPEGSFSRKNPVLKEKFDEKLCEAKDYLRQCFTTSTAKSECYIGMTEEEYDALKIPILPTSELSVECLEAMKKVGHVRWFDTLLQELCTREKGMILVKIHSERLLNLGQVKAILQNITKLLPLHVFEYQLKYLQNNMPAALYLWKAINIYSLKKAIEAPRFQLSDGELEAPTEEVEDDNDADDNEQSASKKAIDIIPPEKEDKCMIL